MAIVRGSSTWWHKPAAHGVLLLFAFFSVFPLLMVISISLRPGNFATGELIPREITLDHWKSALGMTIVDANGKLVPPPFPVLTWLWNSIKVASISALCILLLSTTAAYAFARLRFRLKEQVLSSLLLLQMFPAVLTLVAIYAVFEVLGTYVPWLGLDTHGAVVLSSLGGISLHIWTIKGYYETIPAEIEEAAKVDGATPFQAFWRVLLPMAVPILAVVFVLAFIGAIIEYPVAAILLNSEDKYTLAVGSKQYLYPQNYLWGDFAAAALLSGLPITAVFLASQRYLVGGLTAGGVKS
ncbi:MAG: maltose ABC transporter permease MalG [Myxococcales bacterium]|nr:maltose ABC transporter permease MalG [Myxococcales bacterium]